MRRVLITGALGQIGSELTLALRERLGGNAVLATDIHPEPTEIVGDGGPYRTLDVTDADALTDTLRTHGADTLFHMAAILSARGESDPARCWTINVEGVRHALRAALTIGLDRVILPSTIAVFGPETPKTRTPQLTVTRPQTMYGITKVVGELLGSYAARAHGLDVRGLRYPGIISSETLPGGGTTDYAVDMYYAAVREEPYTCFVGPDTTLPMMYMPDAIRALLELAGADRGVLQHDTSYNVAAFSFSAGELAAAIRKLVPGFTCHFEPDHRDAIASQWPQSIDDTEARRDWGWRHTYDLESMTDDMLARLRNRLAAGRL